MTNKLCMCCTRFDTLQTARTKRKSSTQRETKQTIHLYHMIHSKQQSEKKSRHEEFLRVVSWWNCSEFVSVKTQKKSYFTTKFAIHNKCRSGFWECLLSTLFAREEANCARPAMRNFLKVGWLQYLLSKMTIKLTFENVYQTRCELCLNGSRVCRCVAVCCSVLQQCFVVVVY